MSSKFECTSGEDYIELELSYKDVKLTIDSHNYGFVLLNKENLNSFIEELKSMKEYMDKKGY